MRFLYCSRNFETAHRLAEFITPRGNKWATLISDGNIENVTDRDILIRWGCYGNTSLDSRFSKVINTSTALQAASNKYQALCKLIDAGVRVPGMWGSNIYQIPRHEFPVLRRKYHHTRGLDIRFCRTRRIAFRKPRGDYYSKFILGQNEYRIHVFDGKIIRASKKVPLIQEANKIIKNSRNGWGFDEVAVSSIPNMNDLQEQSTKSMTAIGLTYGALDIIYEDATTNPYILEVNSAPRLNLYGRKTFRRAVKAFMRGRAIVPLGLDSNTNRRTTRDAERLRGFLRTGLRERATLMPVFQEDQATEENIEFDEEIERSNVR